MRRSMMAAGASSFVAQGTLVAAVYGVSTGYGDPSNGNFGSYSGTIYNGRTVFSLFTQSAENHLDLYMNGAIPTVNTTLVIQQGGSEVLSLTIAVADWFDVAGPYAAVPTTFKFTSGQTYKVSLT